MAYNEALTARLRDVLAGAGVKNFEEKKMFRGVTFMVDGKMCISAGDTRIMCRIDPALHESAVERNGATTVKMKGRDYIGYIYVDEEGFKNPRDLKYWVDLCLDFNKKARASKKKSPSKKKAIKKTGKAPGRKK
jgi:hypothetical protein